MHRLALSDIHEEQYHDTIFNQRIDNIIVVYINNYVLQIPKPYILPLWYIILLMKNSMLCGFV